MKYTDKEIRDMILAELEIENGKNIDNESLSENCHYSLTKNYFPDCPGWTRDILTVIFSYDSHIYNFRITKNRLEKITPKR